MSTTVLTVCLLVGLHLGCSSASKKVPPPEKPSSAKSQGTTVADANKGAPSMGDRSSYCGRSHDPLSHTPRQRVVSQDGSTGAVEGVVFGTYGQPVAGVSLVAKSPSLEGAQTAITDSHGGFCLVRLPPGDYVVTFFYDVLTEEAEGVQVKADEATKLEKQIPYP